MSDGNGVWMRGSLGGVGGWGVRMQFEDLTIHGFWTWFGFSTIFKSMFYFPNEGKKVILATLITSSTFYLEISGGIRPKFITCLTVVRRCGVSIAFYDG